MNAKKPNFFSKEIHISFFKSLFFSPYFYLASFITVIWSVIHKKLSWSDWQIPLGYSGDNLMLHTVMKNYAELNWLTPLNQKFISNLNAPIGANWSGWPIIDEIPNYVFGILGHFVGVYPAMNLLLLFSYVAAGLSFLYVARNYKIKLPLAIAGAIAFAFCNILIVRGLAHVTVGLVWHIPIMLMIVHLAYQKNNFNYPTKKIIFVYLFCFICGGFNIYYSIMILFFLGFAFLLNLLRKNYQSIKFPLVCISIIISSVLIWNFDSFRNTHFLGENLLMQGRNLASLQLYALQLPELFYQPHSRGFIGHVGNHFFYGGSMLKGEFWSPYLGIVGSICFLTLMFYGTLKIFEGKFKQVTTHYYHSMWILLFSMVGGINLVIGTLGFTWLRATNRFSVFLLVIGLLFTLKLISKKTPKQVMVIVAVSIFSMTYYEFIHTALFSKSDPSIQISRAIEDDKKLVSFLENKYPNSNVFQYPAAVFPENGPVLGMQDYEHLRPYLHSKTLSFSYGNVKGRGDYDWHKEISELPPPLMAYELFNRDFDLLMVHKFGLPDYGNIFKKILIASGYEFVTESETFYVFSLKDKKDTGTDPFVTYGKGWSPDEGAHRWTNSSRSEIEFFEINKNNSKVKISFKLTTLKESTIKILFNQKELKEIDLKPGVVTDEMTFTLDNNYGVNTFEIISDTQPVLPGNGDARLLGTMVLGLQYKFIKN